MKRQPLSYSILCINAGSSSVKTTLFRVGTTGEPGRLAEIEASGIGEDDACIAWQIGEQCRERRRSFDSHHDALAAVLDLLREQELPDPNALGHRIVHSPRGSRPN